MMSSHHYGLSGDDIEFGRAGLITEQLEPLFVHDCVRYNPPRPLPAVQRGAESLCLWVGPQDDS